MGEVDGDGSVDRESIVYMIGEKRQNTLDCLPDIKYIKTTTSIIVCNKMQTGVVIMSESIGVNRIKDVDSLNEFLRPFGYAYDPEQDVFYTIVDAWQRQMGYTRMYDEAAALASMILDSEPVYFEYDNKRWMIEFWKGQYCMTTGFEVGIYYTDKREKSNEYFNWTLYDCADDEHMLNMEFTLTKNGKPIIERKEKHWWLAGFKLGEFSQPWELRLVFLSSLKI